MILESLFLTFKANSKLILGVLAAAAIAGGVWATYNAGVDSGRLECAENQIAALEDRNRQFQAAQAEIRRLQKERDQAQADLAVKEQDIAQKAQETINDLTQNKDAVIDRLRRTTDGLSVDLRSTKADAATSRLAASTLADYARDQARLSESAVRFFVGEATRADTAAVLLGSCQQLHREREQKIKEYNRAFDF